ncbi:hypothetical protein BU14_0022s0107 [Porphyra umbilicalis]|uniref:Uncharacterized protein n=1 Tax=Porphyra umbilicalis TaxID=2786 RepID=A0A1X6PKK4_PORUM|nr:hypothetical protein BU14_0022s0107 [Porphyra umbilicalis]|eukprot:OSX81387.1 hypothetical protein BU14_0022s0107 [Porphyra umbilicalis]
MAYSWCREGSTIRQNRLEAGPPALASGVSVLENIPF